MISKSMRSKQAREKFEKMLTDCVICEQNSVLTANSQMSRRKILPEMVNYENLRVEKLCRVKTFSVIQSKTNQASKTFLDLLTQTVKADSFSQTDRESHELLSQSCQIVITFSTKALIAHHTYVFVESKGE